MKTVLAWLVANIETALSVVLIAVFVPLFMSQMDLTAYTSAQRWGFALVLAFMVILHRHSFSFWWRQPVMYMP